MKKTAAVMSILALASVGARGEAAKTFGEDVAFMSQHAKVIVLEGPGGRKVAVVPAYQGRVMTSSAQGDDGASFGFLKYDVIARGVPPEAERKDLDRHILVFGGEERMWLGPEGGQYAIFFPAGTTNFAFETWKTPPLIDDATWDVVESGRDRVKFSAKGHLVNVAGTAFDVGIERTVSVMDDTALAGVAGQPLPEGVAAVGYETANLLRNTGAAAWTRDTGLLSIWMLGMMKPGPGLTVVIPVADAQAKDTVVSTDYFGPVGADRLVVKDGAAFFKCDGKSRTKIGIPRAHAKPICGSWDAKAGVLTLLKFNLPAEAAGLPYVKSQWVKHADPYAGDALNSYNDGPNDTGSQLGPFYEIESSSPALALPPGGEYVHTSQTVHLAGPRAALDAIARNVLGVGLDAIEKALP